VAERVQKDKDACAELEELERDFLMAFTQAVGRMCREQYENETRRLA
jgi:hypothetical protein